MGWSEVDLRWGVTDEQKAEGAVLPICLAEIDRSRPYFVGLLGQRYGWVPDELPADLAAQMGWLADATDRSVTELEILHGVLNDAQAAGHAYFYLRDPQWVDALAPEERATYATLVASAPQVTTTWLATSSRREPNVAGSVASPTMPMSSRSRNAASPDAPGSRSTPTTKCP